ncbi:hypothetical protein HaLaN_00827 [Haematococcus lacustris]|uniref:Uncharacterized protein n=1 Tax=Haematococcus lacustris TaxID=44745 RepID=A0A699YA77_HAELA|nr:hypothetical protein HaLaN_00827 [Haematococcus lacustris]
MAASHVDGHSLHGGVHRDLAAEVYGTVHARKPHPQPSATAEPPGLKCCCRLKPCLAAAVPCPTLDPTLHPVLTLTPCAPCPCLAGPGAHHPAAPNPLEYHHGDAYPPAGDWEGGGHHYNEHLDPLDHVGRPSRGAARGQGLWFWGGR